MFCSDRIKDDTLQLNELESLLNGKIKGKIVEHTAEPLISPGSNYGGELVRVDVTIEEDGQRKIFNAVAKLIPPTQTQMTLLNTQVTFKNEIAFYANMVPLLQDFQREHGLSKIADYFPKLYGSRISLKEHIDIVDTDGVILLENLKLEGYTNIDKQPGFDLTTTKKILELLANFQATALSLKLKKNDVFFSKIRPNLTLFAPPQMVHVIDLVIQQLVPNLNENPNTAPLISKISRCMSKNSVKEIREPWATITHNDFWVNNIMVKIRHDITDSIKLIDFQLIDFGSPASDLFFFLFTSVQTSVLRYHFDKILLSYYNEFINTLQQFKIDVKEFSYESFQEELRIEAGNQMIRTLHMIMNVMFDPQMPKVPGKVPKWNPNRQSNEMENGSPSGGLPKSDESNDNYFSQLTQIKLSVPCKERIWFMIEEAAKRKWI